MPCLCNGAAGDLYLLKLYRDFLLHQTWEDRTPSLDWGHIVESLNKLDAGLPEKVRAAVCFLDNTVRPLQMMHGIDRVQLSCLASPELLALLLQQNEWVLYNMMIRKYMLRSIPPRTRIREVTAQLVPSAGDPD